MGSPFFWFPKIRLISDKNTQLWIRIHPLLALVAMSTIITKQNDADVHEFINAFSNTEQKRQDAFRLLEFMQDVTGYEPKMWGTSIIGFGKYHYRSERSRQEGDWPLVGFSPRKAAIALYVFTGHPEHEHLLAGLGKFKRGKACIYANKLTDINLDTLKKLIVTTTEFLRARYGESETT